MSRASRSILTAAVGAALTWSATASAATVVYSKTYDAANAATQGGPYFRSRVSPTFATNALRAKTSGDNVHGQLYDQGFSTNLSSFTISITHVSSQPGVAHGIIPYGVAVGDSRPYTRPGSTVPSTEVQALGGIGGWVMNSAEGTFGGPYDFRFGVFGNTQLEDNVIVSGQYNSVNRPDNNANGLLKYALRYDSIYKTAGDAVTSLDVTGLYQLTVDVINVGSCLDTGGASGYDGIIDDENARLNNKFVYTFEQEANGQTQKWEIPVTFQQLYSTVYTDATAYRKFHFMEDYAWDPTKSVNFGFYNKRGSISSTFGDETYWDNLQITAVPEPTSLAAVGLGGLMLLRRARRQ